jgi:ankyrin repeat protein
VLPISEAAVRGNIDAVRILLDGGADVNQGDPQYSSTPLIGAVNGAHREIVELLVATGANVNQADVRGQTPLIRAIFHPGTVGDSEERRTTCLALARFFVDKGANVNHAMEDGSSPLMCAVNENWRPMIRFLLDAGADARHVDTRGRGLVRRAVDGILRLGLADEPALALVRSMVDAGARDSKDAADWARKRGRTTLADSIDQLTYK